MNTVDCETVKSLYIHIPFCLSKCDYCAFYSIIPQENSVELFVKKLVGDIKDFFKTNSPDIVQTVFVGGGNPGCIDNKHLVQLTNLIGSFNNLRECTFEINPETLTHEKAQILSSIKNIRLSIGVQRLNDYELELLGRKSSVSRIYDAFEVAFKHFKNISADFIIGMPDSNSIIQSLDGFLKRFPVKHISSYYLTLEPDTSLEKKIRQGKLSDPHNHDSIELLDVKQLLSKHGFEHYEISNFSKRNFCCSHNLNYWNAFNYMGFGPAAVSTIEDKRFKNPSDLELWFNNEGVEIETLEHKDMRNEFVMLALRNIQDGLNLDELYKRYFSQPEFFERAIERFVDQKVLQKTDNKIKLTDKGLMFADRIISELFI